MFINFIFLLEGITFFAKIISVVDCFLQFSFISVSYTHLQATGGYRANLQRYIKENQAKGVYPVLVTPIARNTWRLRDQTYLDLLEEFADVCLELGAQYGIPVLDLHAHSKKYVLEKGCLLYTSRCV